MSNEQHRRGSPLPATARARLDAAIRHHGVKLVLAASGGLSRGALASAVGGLPVIAGTQVLVRQAVDRLETHDARPTAAEQIVSDDASKSGGRQ